LFSLVVPSRRLYARRGRWDVFRATITITINWIECLWLLSAADFDNQTLRLQWFGSQTNLLSTDSMRSLRKETTPDAKTQRPSTERNPLKSKRYSRSFQNSLLVVIPFPGDFCTLHWCRHSSYAFVFASVFQIRWKLFQRDSWNVTLSRLFNYNP
jgi:hypothetical protein